MSPARIYIVAFKLMCKFLPENEPVQCMQVLGDGNLWISVETSKGHIIRRLIITTCAYIGKECTHDISVMPVMRSPTGPRLVPTQRR